MIDDDDPIGTMGKYRQTSQRQRRLCQIFCLFCLFLSLVSWCLPWCCLLGVVLSCLDLFIVLPSCFVYSIVRHCLVSRLVISHIKSYLRSFFKVNMDGIELRTLGENESDTARLYTGAEGLMSASFVQILSFPFLLFFFLVRSRLVRLVSSSLV